jgi:hypothetical protein
VALVVNRILAVEEGTGMRVSGWKAKTLSAPDTSVLFGVWLNLDKDTLSKEENSRHKADENKGQCVQQ